MSSTLNDTFDTAKSFVASANEGAQQATDSAKQAFKTAKLGADSAVTSARATWLDGVKAVGGVISLLRSFEADDALGWVGLARRRGPALSFGIFSAGVAVGAGVGVLFAPMSGLALRRQIMKSFTELTGKAKDVAQQVGSQAKNVEAKVEDAAGKVKDAAIQAEHKAVSSATAFKDAAAAKVESAATKVDSAATATRTTPSENGKIHHPS